MPRVRSKTPKPKSNTARRKPSSSKSKTKRLTAKSIAAITAAAAVTAGVSIAAVMKALKTPYKLHLFDEHGDFGPDISIRKEFVQINEKGVPYIKVSFIHQKGDTTNVSGERIISFDKTQSAFLFQCDTTYNNIEVIHPSNLSERNQPIHLLVE